MAFFDRTRREIVSKSLERLDANTNITQLAPGSKARFILDTVAQEQENQHRIFDVNLMQVFIKYANGKFLDFFGDMLNLPRKEPVHGSDDSDNLMFYVSSGVFGDINSGIDITLPVGTIVETIPFDSTVITPGIESQPVIQYATTQTVVAPANSSFVYAPVRAVVEGRNSDVPKNVLNKHNFTSYIYADQQKLKCTNKYSISNGQDRESDESYRYRLSQVFEAKNLAVFAAIRLAALSIPGVNNIKEVMCEQGPGTYSLYIKGFTPTTSTKLLSEVSAACQLVTSYGIRPFILAPSPIGIELVAAVTWVKKATAQQITDGYKDMRNAAENYINELDIGDELVLEDLIDIMLSSTRYVLSIGGNKINQFEDVYIYRKDPLREGTVRSLMVGDKIEPLYNERVVLETSGRHRGIQFITRSNL